MNIIHTLKKDHRTVEGLFKKIGDTDQPFGKQALFFELRDEFEAHAAAEEEIVYPELKKFPELKSKAEHSVKEHNQARELIVLLEEISPEDEKWITTVKELEESIAHHVKEEEDEIFPKLETLVKEERLVVLADEFEESKHKLLKAG